jgi:hypothetical protein
MKWASTALFALCASTGCITFPAWKDQAKTQRPLPVAVQRPPGEIVKPEQISDSNAREKASQLAEELDADTRR